MREVNFSIPNANKASVGITTALYDRRALDCTSTLPLINSLNHLAYLTTSSARIRDILTVDGGIERLICILKEGRTKDMMDMWKWNLAFQCIFNIGVRGSENVRTRVVEADMVPVIASILDNYIKVVDKMRARAEAADMHKSSRMGASSRHHSSRTGEAASSSAAHRSDRPRRTIPPPIEIPRPLDAPLAEATPVPSFSLSSPPERTTFARGRPPHHHHHRSHEARAQQLGTPANNNNTTPTNNNTTTTRNLTQPLLTALPSMDATNDAFALRPVRDADRLPSMLPALQAEMTTSQPESPTTPSAPQASQTSPRAGLARTRRRPSIRHQLSVSGESDLEVPQDDMSVEAAPAAATPAVNEPIVGIQNNEINMADIVANAEMLDAGNTPVPIAAPSEGTDENNETFNITHRPALDGSIINPTNTPPNNPITGFSPMPPTINVVNTNPPPPWYPRYAQERNASASVLAAMPRDEDVLMSLQLLAYVSKYCNLRSYFQKSHLVPKLRIGMELLDGETPTPKAGEEEEEELEEYELPDDFNIFPLVEQFTVRHHTSDMQYWASVVMRNLCRKDDSRGGIRQCAYYQCGRWEEYTRQFAKCRRCRRTKYCSKECQKSAWVFHRHWCVAAT